MGACVPGFDRAGQQQAEYDTCAYSSWDLAGSAAVFRIKEEMLSRTTQALGTGAVRDVLIQDLVQQ